MSDAPPGRPMKFPYTMAAKIVQFPYKFHWDNSPLFKWWIISSVLCLPIFYKIQKLTFSPGNVEKWRKLDYEALYPSEDHH